MLEETTDITQILTAAAAGDQQAKSELVPLVYDELRKLALYRFRNMAPGQSLQPTDLVHEAYLKLLSVEQRSWESRRHFIDAAGVAMRNILVDRARARLALKRGGDRTRQPLDDDLGDANRDPQEIIDVDDALRALSEIDARAAQVVELRFFLGLSDPEIADVLGVTESRVSQIHSRAIYRLNQMMEGQAKA